MINRFLGTVVMAALIINPILSKSASQKPAGYALSSDSKTKIMGSGLIVGLTAAVSTYACLGFDLTKLKPILAAGALGALAGGFFAYWDSDEKSFERNARYHFDNAHTQLKKFKKNGSIQAALAADDITKVKSWYSEDDRDDLYKEYPMLSAHRFLERWKNHLLYILKNIFEKLVQCDVPYHDKIEHDRMLVIFYIQELAHCIEKIEKSHEYKKQCKEYNDVQAQHYYASNNAYAQHHTHHHTVQQTIVYQPYPVAPAPVYYVPAPAPASKPAPKIAPAPAPAPATQQTGGYLNGDVYGTIWSNY